MTHVTASIFLLYIVYVQKPRTMLIVGHGNSWISSNHVAIHGQYGRLFKVHPSYLRIKIFKFKLIIKIFHDTFKMIVVLCIIYYTLPKPSTISNYYFTAQCNVCKQSFKKEWYSIFLLLRESNIDIVILIEIRFWKVDVLQLVIAEVFFDKNISETLLIQKKIVLYPWGVYHSSHKVMTFFW